MLKIEHLTKAFGDKLYNMFNKTLDDVLQDIKVGKADEMEGFVLNID